MMTNHSIAPATQQTVSVASTPNYGGINFFDNTAVDNAVRCASFFSNSSLVPDSYRIGAIIGGKSGDGPKKTVSEQEAIANCIIAFDIASRIGAAPLMVMQNLYIVHGRPSWSSKFLIATINACGRFEPLKFEMTACGVCSNGVANVKCVAWTTPKGVTHDEHGRPITAKSPLALRGTAITIQMAIDESWYNKPGSKWRAMPEQMLRYRAASFWTSTNAPEISMGIRTVEESEDMGANDVYTQVSAEIDNEAQQQTVVITPLPDYAQEQDAGINVCPVTGEIQQVPDPDSCRTIPQTETTEPACEDGPGY